MNVWGWLECPACGQKVPSFRFMEHRRACETKDERNDRLRSELEARLRARDRREEGP